MAIKRHVTITCDGPCGKMLEASKIPEDWSWLTFSPIGGEKKNDARRKRAALCPSCVAVAEARLKQFAFVKPATTGEEGEEACS